MTVCWQLHESTCLILPFPAAKIWHYKQNTLIHVLNKFDIIFQDIFYYCELWTNSSNCKHFSFNLDNDSKPDYISVEDFALFKTELLTKIPENSFNFDAVFRDHTNFCLFPSWRLICICRNSWRYHRALLTLNAFNHTRHSSQNNLPYTESLPCSSVQSFRITLDLIIPKRFQPSLQQKIGTKEAKKALCTPSTLPYRNWIKIADFSFLVGFHYSASAGSRNSLIPAYSLSPYIPPYNTQAWLSVRTVP